MAAAGRTTARLRMTVAADRRRRGSQTSSCGGGRWRGITRDGQRRTDDDGAADTEGRSGMERRKLIFGAFFENSMNWMAYPENSVYWGANSENSYLFGPRFPFGRDWVIGTRRCGLRTFGFALLHAHPNRASKQKKHGFVYICSKRKQGFQRSVRFKVINGIE